MDLELAALDTGVKSTTMNTENIENGEHPEGDLGAVFVLADSIISKESSAGRLNELSIQYAEYKISGLEYQDALRKEIQQGRMLYADKDCRVELTGRVLGCLAEIAGSDHRRYYVAAEQLVARRVKA